ncbi:MAG: hypothetical protein H7259_07745 [Cytophagales bacterium]|nr:hypothetical protein [Cytophaga sp.]
MNISEETIDLYLRGDLSEPELQAFKRAIDADPKLKQEIDFQSDVVNSLKNYRHQQLKSRFDKLEIPAGGNIIGSGYTSSIYTKFAASILVVALLIGGSSIWLNNQNPTQTPDSNNSVAVVPTTPSPSKNEVTKTENSSAVIANTTQENVISANTSQAKKASKTTVKVSIKQNRIRKDSELFDEVAGEQNSPDMLNPDFEMPVINDGTSSAGIQNVKVNIVKEKNLGYRFFNNQLFLHGNFSNSTYELFELNNAPSKQLYLYFENNYYELLQGKTKVTSLNPITNKATLVQLNQLRER